MVANHDRKAAMNSTTQVRALCCECGSLRTVSAKYKRFDQNWSDDYRPQWHPRGWRATNTLKCATCKSATRHAQIRDDLSADALKELESQLRACPLEFDVACGLCSREARFAVWVSHSNAGCCDAMGFRCALHAAEILEHWESGLGGVLRCGCEVDTLEEHVRVMPL